MADNTNYGSENFSQFGTGGDSSQYGAVASSSQYGASGDSLQYSAGEDLSKYGTGEDLSKKYAASGAGQKSQKRGLKDLLTMEIGGKGGKKGKGGGNGAGSAGKGGKNAKAKLPQKRTMNLAMIQNKDNSLKRVLPMAVILGIAIVIFCKVAVIDRIADLGEARQKYEQSRATLTSLETALEAYPEVHEKYLRYTDNYQNAEEYVIVNRIQLINMLDEVTSGLGSISSISVVDNSVSLEVTAANLDNVAAIKARLDAEELVQSVRVYTADTSDSDRIQAGRLKASVLITIADPEKEATAPASSTDTESSVEGEVA